MIQNQPNFIALAQQDGRLRQAQLKMLNMLEVVDEICLKHKIDYWLDGGSLLGAVRHQGFIPWDDDLDISMPRASYEHFLRVAPAEIPANMWLQTAQTDPGFFNLSVPLKIRDRNSRFVEAHEQGNEPYQQGIFIDVFVYDSLPVSPFQRKLYKVLAKKILRLLRPKYSAVEAGHGARLYQLLEPLFSKQMLERALQRIIHKANTSGSPYLGTGYQCVNSNLVAHTDIFPLKRARFETREFNIPNRFDLMLKDLYGDYMTLPPEDQRVMKHCKELIPELI
ncbi:LicD family protein [Legionella micdadei]|uniref:LicD family protein n=1 Tax=Legionella micdadei TaxID=451 RepID=UPI0020A40D28|nr:LicD family protein [Legionella micdadei]